jgi:hypothetical protein
MTGGSGRGGLLRRAFRFLTPSDLRFRGYFFVMRTPALWWLYVSSRSVLRSNLVTPDVDLVVDGYPRSANSYVRVALERSQAERCGLRLSTHLHSPRAVLRAVRLQLPCMILLRDPRDAAASLVQLLPGLRLRSAFRIYERYYTPLLAHVDHVHVAAFADVVSDLRGELAKVNAKFETSFTIADPYASMSSEAMSGIDDRSALFTYKNSPWNVVARPSRDRATSETLLSALDGKTAER